MYIHVDVYIFILMLKMRTYHILLHIHSHTVFYLWWSIKCMIEIYTSKDKKKTIPNTWTSHISSIGTSLIGALD